MVASDAMSNTNGSVPQTGKGKNGTSHNNNNNNNSNNNNNNGSGVSSSVGSTDVDMSCRIGGRTVVPHFRVVDGSHPTATERSFQAALERYCYGSEDSEAKVPIESMANQQRRHRALADIGTICRDWIRFVCSGRLPPDVDPGGQVFTSGSYRLGIHEPGADIDTILVCPSPCTRADFFGMNTNSSSSNSNSSNNNNNNNYDNNNNNNSDTKDEFYRDPQSLAERIRVRPETTNFVAIENAAVPILTFDWDGINIDLAFARLSSSFSAHPSNLDIDRDHTLDGVDSATEKSLNGPRVTNLIYELVSGTEERYSHFLTCVRCVRKWARARGLYSNKMGYWGGVNINICVALIVQMYPNANAATLLRKFFLVFRSWRWPTPVLLTAPYDAELGLPVWSQYGGGAGGGGADRQVAPIVTPAYPAMNSSLSITRQTLQIIHEEICRGYDVIDALWKTHVTDHHHYQQQQQQQQQQQNNHKDVVPNVDFDRLLEPSPFFLTYPYYLSLCLVGPNKESHAAWCGYVESRLRRLVSDYLGRSLPLAKLQLWPKKFEDCCTVDVVAPLSVAQRSHAATYFIGFRVDTLRMRGTQLNVEGCFQNFRRDELGRYRGPGSSSTLSSGGTGGAGSAAGGATTGAANDPHSHSHSPQQQLDLLVLGYRGSKSLPDRVFDSLGGRDEAMKLRKRIRKEQQLQQQQQQQQRTAAPTTLVNPKAAMKLRAARMEEELKAKKAEMEERIQRLQQKMMKQSTVPNPTTTTLSSTLTSTPTLTISNGMGEDDPHKNEPDRVDEDEETARLERALDHGGKTLEEAEKDRKQQKQQQQQGTKRKSREEEGDSDDALSLDNAISNDDVSSKVRSDSHTPDGDTPGPLVPGPDPETDDKDAFVVVPLDECTALGPTDLRTRARASGTQTQTATHTYTDTDTDTYTDTYTTTSFQFRTVFDVVEIDDDGHVIDKGDADFTPSKSWAGRKAGFEFKLGERGLGYYRTGKPVVVPPNDCFDL